MNINGVIPADAKFAKCARTLQSYIEEINRIKMEEIIMNHRSSVVFDLIDQTFERTRNLCDYIEFNFYYIMEKESDKNNFINERCNFLQFGN